MPENETFGVPAKSRRTVSHLAPVPMFDPMLAAARDTVQALTWFRREVTRAETMCTNMEQVVTEMLESKIAEDAAKHVQAAVFRLRDTTNKASNFCTRLENLTAELQGGTFEEGEDTFQGPARLMTKLASVAHE